MCAKALARLHGRAGSSEPSLVAYVISTIISSAGSILIIPHVNFSYKTPLGQMYIFYFCTLLWQQVIVKKNNHMGKGMRVQSRISKDLRCRDSVWCRPSDIVRNTIQMSEALMTRQDIWSENIFLDSHCTYSWQSLHFVKRLPIGQIL